MYPGLYLFTCLARMMRPVRNLATDSIEYIGSLEQARKETTPHHNHDHRSACHYTEKLVFVWQKKNAWLVFVSILAATSSLDSFLTSLPVR